MRLLSTLVFLTAFTLCVAGVAAQTTSPTVPTINASPGDDIRVDAVLDEPEWANAETASGFIQYEPDEGADATRNTEAKVLYSESSLYVSAVLYDDPTRIRTNLSRRDNLSDADWFLVAIDSDNDQRSMFEFAVTAANVQFDALFAGNSEDASWDAVWTSATRLTDEGWMVEIEIPYSQLRFSPGTTSWGLNFTRRIARNDEKVFWAPYTREQEQSGIVQYLGRLDGLEGIQPRRVLQVAPYTLGRVNRFTPEAATSPTTDFEADVGADLKLGLASNVTLDATINPDFGQVDADPSELNLTTFETFFDERRPFFLEGTQIFDLTYASGDGALLYTRRIGAAAPIIAATKITGRTAGGLSFGALGATTGHDFDPSQLYAAARIKQELEGQDYLGGGATVFSNWEDSLAVSSVAVGGDWDVRVGSNKDWKFEGTATGTYQDRPNADPFGYAVYMGFDRVKGFVKPGSGIRVFSDAFEINDVGRFVQNNLISLRGGAGVLWNRGRPIGPFRRLETQGFATQEFRYTDVRNRGLSTFFNTNGQLHGFHQVDLTIDLAGIGGHDVRETRGLGTIENVAQITPSLSFTTDSRQRFSAYIEGAASFHSDGGTSLDPSVGFDWTVNNHLSLSFDAELSYGTNQRAWVANEAFIRTDDDLLIGTTPAAPDQVPTEDFEPLGISQNQAVALLEDLLPYSDDPVAGGTPYYQPIFAVRDTRAASLTTRANVLFTPNLSLQLYGQLFAARGHYEDFSLLAAPDELRPFETYPRPHDFAFSTFNLNTVLRWEYRPGSTLYVVWTQARNVDDFPFGLTPPAAGSPFETSTFNQFGDTFRAFPDNVFLIKLSYLFLG